MSAAHAAPVQHGLEAPSPWVQRWAHLLPAGGSVLDLACGAGRHSRYLARLGHPVTAVDRNPDALGLIADCASTVLADIENDPWPLVGRQFAGVVVTNYLWRTLLPAVVASVAPGGVLIYETFAAGNETVGKPSRPDFLLQPGELLRACADLQVVAYEHGFLPSPARFVQRIAAVRPLSITGPHQSGGALSSIPPPRYPLGGDLAG